MKLLLTKDGNAVTIDASPHSFRLEAITTALLNLGVEAAYSLAIIELDQHGPFVRASCRLFRLHDGVPLQSNILQWHTGALKEA